MSLKNKIGLAFDVAVLVAASTVTAKAAVSAFEMFKREERIVINFIYFANCCCWIVCVKALDTKHQKQ